MARTVRVAVTDLLPYVARLAGSRTHDATTTTREGLALVRASFSRTLRRLAVDVEVLGSERVPEHGGLVLMWKQESHLDHLVLASAVPRPFFSLYNNAVARIPFYGTRLRATGHVHVDRNDAGQWRAGVARAAERVRAGECVLVSPEGTRSWDRRLLPMKRGAMALAIAAARPVVCVVVLGAHDRMPRGSAFVRAGLIRVVFADPFEPPADVAALERQLVDTFEGMALRA